MLRAPGTRSKGFTLVEILVVVVIMAVVISLAVLSVGVNRARSPARRGKPAHRGVDDMLHERALLEGRDFGMLHRADGLRVPVYDTRTAIAGSPRTTNSEFRHRDLPKGVSFQLQLDSIAVVLKPVEPRPEQCRRRPPRNSRSPRAAKGRRFGSR